MTTDKIQVDQLKGLKKLISTYTRNAAVIENAVARLDGVRVQARGRKADPQGYYAFVLFFDSAPMKDIPLANIIAALNAEGLEALSAAEATVRFISTSSSI